MPGQEHAGLAEELPAGALPKDEQCQAPSRSQRSTSRSRRLLQAGPQQTLGSPQWVRTPSTLHSAQAEPKGCSPLRNSSVVMDLTRTRLVWSHHEAQQAGTEHPAQPPAPTASRGDGTAMGREAQAPSSSARPVLLKRGDNPPLEPAAGHGKGPAWCGSGWGGCRQASRLAAPSLTLGKG